MAAKLDHVNTIRGIDVGKEGNTHYFAIEFVEGALFGNPEGGPALPTASRT